MFLLWGLIMIKRVKLVVRVMGIVVFGASMPGLQGQAPGAGLEKQLKSQYAVTRVGANGVLIHTGTVLRVLKDGIRSMPASYAVFWPNNYKNGAKVGYHWSCPKCRFNVMRQLQVGEMVYLTDVEIKETDLVFRFQSCGECGATGSDQTDPPYAAEMSFQLGKGYLANSTLKEVQATIEQVFEIVPPRQPPPVRPLAPSAGELRVPSVYVSAQASADQIQFKADGTFSLQEGGQAYQGTFSTNGKIVELSISGGPKTAATIQGNDLTDSSGQTWILRDQTAPSTGAAAVLQNQDVIKMVKAGLDDALIIAKIGSSKCQFDTSTDALILLKQSGVSAAVLKAIVSAK